jgi:hypothetical protein
MVEPSVTAYGMWSASLESGGDKGLSCAGRNLAWRVGTRHDIVVTITISTHMITTVTSDL